MYKANKRHMQSLLLSNINDLPEKKRQRLQGSWAEDFYRDFFCRIQEDTFAVLYVDHPSRPNVPINWLVGLETLKSGFGWSDEELYDHFCFDLQVRYALGIHDLNESDFDLRTLYYFRERLSCYNLEHGVNLLTKAFENITDQQLIILKVKTGKQRTPALAAGASVDSTQIASNILSMSRLQLLVEAVQRMYRSLSEADQQHYAKTFAPYLQGHSGQYVYRIKGQEATAEHLQTIGELIDFLQEELRETYGQVPAYHVLQRLFDNNFRLENQVVLTKTNQELEAGCLQSVDDLEATYRKKGPRAYKGYVANLSETCDPENELQLTPALAASASVTKIQVSPNNVNDNDLLLEALPDLKARTGLDTLYTDGAFAGPTVDPVLQEHEVEQIQTGISGRPPNSQKLNLADFVVDRNEKAVPQQITCPQGQTAAVELSSLKSGYRADFNPSRCKTCPFHLEGRCPARLGKKRASFRLTFLPSQVGVAQRRRKLRLSKQDGKNPRAAIEGTIREVKHPFPAGKLPVRGLFRITCLMVGSAALTNVRRIHHFWDEKRKDERRKMAIERAAKVVPEQSGVSFTSFLKSILISQRSSIALSNACFGC